MTPEALAKHVNALAWETKTSAEVVETVTDHFANNIAARAWRSECRCPDGLWLETAMACNAAHNPHARAIIEHKARVAYDALQKAGKASV